MAASRSILEALLARVQQRANEPRTSVVVSARSASPGNRAGEELGGARSSPPPRDLIADEDVEEYDDELIEIIDDAEIIPEAAAAARAIDVGAVVSSLERRASARQAAQSTPPESAPAQKQAPKSAPVSARGAVARPSAPTNGALRPESVSARPPAATQVVQARGVRRELRTTSFVELLDAALKLGV